MPTPKKKTQSSAKAKPRAPRRKVNVELATTRLKELHGYTDDEIKVLFPTDQAIIEAYVAIKNKLSVSDVSLKTDLTAEADDFRLPAEDLEILNTEEESEKSAARKAEAHEIAASDPTGTLTPDDIETTKKDLSQLLQENDL